MWEKNPTIIKQSMRRAATTYCHCARICGNADLHNTLLPVLFMLIFPCLSSNEFIAADMIALWIGSTLA